MSSQEAGFATEVRHPDYLALAWKLETAASPFVASPIEVARASVSSGLTAPPTRFISVPCLSCYAQSLIISALCSAQASHKKLECCRSDQAEPAAQPRTYSFAGQHVDGHTEQEAAKPYKKSFESARLRENGAQARAHRVSEGAPLCSFIDHVGLGHQAAALQQGDTL